MKTYFEPGIHSLDFALIDEQIEEVQNGNLSLHAWNGAVHKRMKSYRPGLIALDSINAIPATSKAELWYGLPGTPRQMNGTDDILVVAGDNTYNASNPTSEDRALDFASGSIWASLGMAGGLLIRSLREGEQSRLTMGRRGFLTGFTGAALMHIQPILTAYSPWRSVIPLSTEIDDITEAASLDHIIDLNHIYTYAEGRAALLITKIHDAAQAIRDRTRIEAGSVVMGSGHMFRSDDSLSDPTLRAKYIRRHLTLILEAMREQPAQSSEGFNVQDVIDAESLVQIFRVQQPDPVRAKQDPVAELDRIVTPIDQFKAPSVVEAIKGLS